MALFDRFKSDKPMTPRLALASSLVYCMGADGEIDQTEIGHLVSVIGGDGRALLDQAVRIARSKPLDQFLAETTPLLSDAQRMCILLNVVDSAMADGHAAGAEQELVGKFQRAFGVPDERFAPFFETLLAKNDRSVFGN